MSTTNRLHFEYDAPRLIEHLKVWKLDPCPACGARVLPFKRLLALPCATDSPFDPDEHSAFAVELMCTQCPRIQLVRLPDDCLGVISIHQPGPNGEDHWTVRRKKAGEIPLRPDC